MSELARGELLHLRLFLENVEVPVIGAMISAAEGGGPAAAQIEIVPTDFALRLKARTLVSLFFLENGSEGDAGTGQISSLEVTATNDLGVDSGRYKLLFSGELFTMMFTKTGAGSRSVVLQCLDLSNNLDTSYLYQMNYSDSAPENAIAGSNAAFVAQGSSARQFDDIVRKPEEVVRSILARSPGSLSPANSGKTGILGGLLGILELLGGVEGLHVGIDAWHTIQEARIRLIDQIGSDTGVTAANIFDQSAFENWLTNSIQGGGTLISFRQLVEMILGYVYYAMVPNPVATYKPGERAIPDWSSIAGAPLFSGGLDSAFSAKVDEMMAQLLEKWNGSSPNRPKAVITSAFRSLEARNRIRRRQGRPPLSEKPNMAHDWGYAVDVSIVGFNIGFFYDHSTADSIEEASTLYQKMLTAIKLEGFSEWEQIVLSGLFTEKELNTVAVLAEFYKDLGAQAEKVGLDWGGTPGAGYAPSALWAMFDKMGGDPVHVQEKGWRAKKEEKFGRSLASLEEEVGFAASGQARDRLYTQFLRPDVWFVSPPVCNIVFPEEVQSLSYTRQMLRETTRLKLVTFNALYEDRVLNQAYFAPQINEVESLESGGLGTVAKVLIYPHEKYSGIVPKYERLSEVSFYARISEDNRIASGRADSQISAQDVNTQLELWAARTAAYNFLSHRYSARSLTATMGFTPRLACGWPALVIDKVALPGAGINDTRPAHFLGMIKTVSHSITQAGGQTSIMLSHARSHRTGDDSDDLFSLEIYKKGATLSTQRNAGPGVFGSRSIAVQRGMPPEDFKFCLRVSAHLQAGGDLEPVPTTWKSSGLGSVGLRKDVVGPFGGELLAIKMQSSDVPVVGSLATTTRTAEFRFSSLTIEEKAPGNEEDPGAVLPLEEAIRPPWVSDEYANENIGSLYRELLGCTSLVEQFGSSVEDAVDNLVQEYSAYALGGGSAHEYVRAVTRRGYASISDIIGTPDRPGFFYHSCGPLENLEGEFFAWMKERARSLTSQAVPGEIESFSGRLDPRKGRYDSVRAYLSDLLRYRGLRG